MIILELWLRKELKAKLALSRPILGSKKRKEREQKVRETRRKPRKNKKEARENQVQGYSKVLLAYLNLSSYFEDMIMIPQSLNMMINDSLACYNKLW